MRLVLVALSVLALAGCGFKLGGDPNTPRDITSRTYDSFYPQPSILVAVTTPPPGMTLEEAGTFVTERMKGSSTYGITILPPGKEAFGDQVATWNFTPTDGGVRVEALITERDRRMVYAAATSPSGETKALNDTVRLVTRFLYQQIAQPRL